MEGMLVLENGSVYNGRFLVEPKGDGPVVGEVVFNTSMTGYQEILTDPSYCGQIITLTYPLIGNYGVHEIFNESKKVHASGFIVNQIFECEDNGIVEFLKEREIPVFAGIDTRKLVKEIREEGTLKGYFISKENKEEFQFNQLNTTFGNEVASVSTKEIYTLKSDNPMYDVVLVDFGFKASIAAELLKRNCNVTVVPFDTDAETIMSYNPQGILLSNGPGDPKDIVEETSFVKELLGEVPIMGICLGHQLLALHLGGDTFKLKYGHRGGNHPVQDVTSKKVWITSQNHGYSVDPNSMPKNVKITHINLNDGTVEGLSCEEYSAFSVQFHPEASPGPKEGEEFFNDFIELIDKGAYIYEKIRA